jgi:hypothetical protein
MEEVMAVAMRVEIAGSEAPWSRAIQATSWRNGAEVGRRFSPHLLGTQRSSPLVAARRRSQCTVASPRASLLPKRRKSIGVATASTSSAPC